MFSEALQSKVKQRKVPKMTNDRNIALTFSANLFLLDANSFDILGSNAYIIVVRMIAVGLSILFAES